MIARLKVSLPIHGFGNTLPVSLLPEDFLQRIYLLVFACRHDLCRPLPGHLVAMKSTDQILDKHNGIGILSSLRLSVFIEFDQQTLNGRLLELKHYSVERGVDALVGQPTVGLVNGSTRSRRKPLGAKVRANFRLRTA